jgi:hypothetical protein
LVGDSTMTRFMEEIVPWVEGMTNE